MHQVGGMGYVAGGATEHAVRSGDLGALRISLENINSKELTLATLASMVKVACETGQANVLQWLMNRAAASNPSQTDLLVEQRDTSGATALHWAAAGGSDGHAEIVQWLLDRADVDIDARDTHGCTALHWAARGGHPEVTRLLLVRSSYGFPTTA